MDGCDVYGQIVHVARLALLYTLSIPRLSSPDPKAACKLSVYSFTLARFLSVKIGRS